MAPRNRNMKLSTLERAREVKRMRDAGVSWEDIAKHMGKCVETVKHYDWQLKQYMAKAAVSAETRIISEMAKNVLEKQGISRAKRVSMSMSFGELEGATVPKIAYALYKRLGREKIIVLRRSLTCLTKRKHPLSTKKKKRTPEYIKKKNRVKFLKHFHPRFVKFHDKYNKPRLRIRTYICTPGAHTIKVRVRECCFYCADCSFKLTTKEVCKLFNEHKKTQERTKEIIRLHEEYFNKTQETNHDSERT
jgi:hypothetical protein